MARKRFFIEKRSHWGASQQGAPSRWRPRFSRVQSWSFAFSFESCGRLLGGLCPTRIGSWKIVYHFTNMRHKPLWMRLLFLLCARTLVKLPRTPHLDLVTLMSLMSAIMEAAHCAWHDVRQGLPRCRLPSRAWRSAAHGQPRLRARPASRR